MRTETSAVSAAAFHTSIRRRIRSAIHVKVGSLIIFKNLPRQD